MQVLAKVFCLVAASAVLPAFHTEARASDHTNLEEGLPTTIEDAYPIAYKGREIQGQALYERTAEGKSQFVLDPRLEFGAFRNGQIKVAVPFRLGSGDRSGSGDIGLEAFYNFNNESLRLPALAVSARADLPSGKNSRGVDTQFKFIATKTLGAGARLQRLHLNLSYFNNARAAFNERSNRYGAVLGYSQRLGPDTVGILDFVREQDRRVGQTANIFELGLRRQVTPLTTLALGAGVGIGRDSPDFWLTGAFQKSF